MPDVILIQSLLRPLDTSEAFDEWSHLLWVMPGLEPLS